MAQGVRSKLRATLGVSVTGIAGPGGGTKEKPVGLVFIALADGDGDVAVKRLRIPGDRDAVRHRAAIQALALVWRATIAGERRSLEPAAPRAVTPKEA
jgi:PncC family amidohydrolase